MDSGVSRTGTGRLPKMPISDTLTALARRTTPGFDALAEDERARVLGDIMGVLCGAPLAAAGLAWLAAVTSTAVLAAQWPHLIALAALVIALEELDFFLVVELRPRRFADFSASLSGLVTWSAALLFGPSALWVALPWWLLHALARRRQFAAPLTRWNRWRNLALNAATITLPGLAALALYPLWGGVFPLPGAAPAQLLPAVYATLVRFGVARLIDLPFFLYFGRLRRVTAGLRAAPALRFYTAMALLPHAIDPFAILAAALYTTTGAWVYYTLVAGILLSSLLAHALSDAAQRAARRAHELAALETLGRALMEAPPDGSGLAAVLQTYVPALFPQWRITVARFPGEVLVHEPAEAPGITPEEWEHLRLLSGARAFPSGARLPWGARVPDDEMLVLAPIRDVELQEAVGAVRISQRAYPDMSAAGTQALVPAVQSLAAQIASALHGAQAYAEALAHEKTLQELHLAGEIQSSFLPDSMPQMAGWQIAATLIPARETSGDFYDFVPFPGDRMGVVVADVADKGVGAALYMALSRTLIRTYAAEHPSQPEAAMRDTNRRILADTRAEQFVTVFYGVLDTLTGTCAYCNAGHNPALVVSRMRNGVQALGQTGIPLGLLEGESWHGASVRLMPGDALLLYTDGVTEAQNAAGEFFGSERLTQVFQNCLGRPAEEILAAVLDALRTFTGNAPPADDITVMAIVRTRTGAEREDVA